MDENINYNILLEYSWTHAIHVVASSLFHVLRFPHQGKIFTVDQLSFFSSSTSDGNVPYMKHIDAAYESVGAGFLNIPL